MENRTTSRAASLDRLSKALNRKGKPTDEHVWGTVESVNADGSYQVRINASGDAARCAACCTAETGDRVLVTIMADGKCAAVGRLGGDLGGGGGTVVYKADDVSNYIAGRVFAYAGTDEPLGCLPCDGRAVSRSEYWELFAAVGTTYGEGNGSTTFNLPNLESRVIVGESDGYALGSTGGEEKHTLSISEMPNHSHMLRLGAGQVAAGTDHARPQSTGTWATGYTEAVGSSQPHNNMQPYIVMRYFITTGKGDATYGKDGATFFPSVSEDGIISWTNDGGYSNPDPVNIKGTKGDPGDSYVLTEQDKTEIAEIVAESIDLSGKLDKAGGDMTGTLTASYSSEGGQVRNIYLVTSEPDVSVGQDGDIAFVIGG